jgi:hypothetical protein
VLERWRPAEPQDDVARRELEAGGAIFIEQEHAVLGHHEAQAVGQRLDVGVARRVRAAVDRGEREGRAAAALEPAGGDLEPRVSLVEGRGDTLLREQALDVVHDAALQEPLGKAGADVEILAGERPGLDHTIINDRLDRANGLRQRRAGKQHRTQHDQQMCTPHDLPFAWSSEPGRMLAHALEVW